MPTLTNRAGVPPVEVRNLRKRYGKGAWANDGVSFAAVGGCPGARIERLRRSQEAFPD